MAQGVYFKVDSHQFRPPPLKSWKRGESGFYFILFLIHYFNNERPSSWCEQTQSKHSYTLPSRQRKNRSICSARIFKSCPRFLISVTIWLYQSFTKTKKDWCFLHKWTKNKLTSLFVQTRAQLSNKRVLWWRLVFFFKNKPKLTCILSRESGRCAFLLCKHCLDGCERREWDGKQLLSQKLRSFEFTPFPLKSLTQNLLKTHLLDRV